MIIMFKKRWIPIAGVFILLFGCLIFSDRIWEALIKSALRRKFSIKLSENEYVWNGDKNTRLVSLRIYSHQKKGTQRTCMEYTVESRAILTSYTLEGFDQHGFRVYYKELTADEEEEMYWVFSYDPLGRITESATYENGELSRIQSHCYYDNGMAGVVVQDYREGSLNPASSYEFLFDSEDRLCLYKDYESGQYYGEKEGLYTTLDLGRYGREELVCDGDRLVEYSWYELDDNGNPVAILRVLPEESEGTVHYACTYSSLTYDSIGRLISVYEYELIRNSRAHEFSKYRSGDVIRSGVDIRFYQDGEVREINSFYFPVKGGAGLYLYTIRLHEDGTFELLTNEVQQLSADGGNEEIWQS